MTITTMEELTSIPVGEALTVNNISWTRSTGGLDYQGGTVPLDQFTHYLRSGGITRGPLYQAKQVWRDNNTGWTWVTIAPAREDEGEGWWCGRYYQHGEFSSLQVTNPPPNCTNRTDETPWLEGAYSTAIQLVAKHRDMLTARADRDLMRTARDEAIRARREAEAGVASQAVLDSFKEQAASQLSAVYASSNLDSDGRETLVTAMGELGLELERQTVNVTVVAYCSMNRSLNSDEVTAWVPDGADINDRPSLNVSWTQNVTVPVQVPGGGCGCDEVDPDQIRAALGVGFEGALDDWESDGCSSEDC
jgi:hypothetical protein